MPNLVRRRCGRCNGTGEVDVGEYVSDYHLCPVCHGTKEVRVPSNYGVCGVCRGSGEKDIGDFSSHIMLCKNCKGTGWAPPPLHIDSNNWSHRRNLWLHPNSGG